MSLVRGYGRGRSWVIAHWRRPHPAEPEQLPMPRTGDDESPGRLLNGSGRHPQAPPNPRTRPQA